MSKYNVKTYSRNSQKVCQSSIQFDQLFDDKTKNKPSAAKSTGTLHRWGMTSFTSLRNTNVNGSVVGDEDDDEPAGPGEEGRVKPIKRIKIAVDDDPFSFDAESESAKATYKVHCISTSNTDLSSSKSSAAAAAASKVNKFFKSGASRSFFKLKGKTENICSGSKRSSSSSSNVTNVLVPVVNSESLQDKQSITYDAFSALMASNANSGLITGDPFDALSQAINSEEPMINVQNAFTTDDNITNESVDFNLVLRRDSYSKGYETITTASSSKSAIEKMERLVVTQVPNVPMSGYETIDSNVESMSVDDAAQAMITNEDIAVSEAANALTELKSMVPNYGAEATTEPRGRIPPLTIRIPQLSSLRAVELTDSGEDSVDSIVVPIDSTQEVESEPLSAVVRPTLETRSKSERLMRSASTSFSVMRTRRIFNSPKKGDKKAIYKHRPWQAEEDEPDLDDDDGGDEAVETTASKEKSLADEFDEHEAEIVATHEGEGDEEERYEEEEKPVLTRVTTWPTRIGDEAITSIRCPKKIRKLYTVVKNVKQAHQCHESGETQEFNDDIEYLLDGIQETNGVGTRCLSILSLAGKCMAAAFRMHLRAHGTLTKVFSALHDAPKDPNLSLCTSTVMFILSQDRLNMDLERRSLELMLQLLDVETRPSDAVTNTTNGHNREYDKNKVKVRELCDQLQKRGHAKHLDLDNITSGVLSMETLLSLTSRRAGEWFKEELRELGGLDHLVNTVSECGKSLPDGLFHLTEFALDKLRKLDRCLRVLENVTIMNSQNQSYLMTCQNSSLIFYCARALKLCERSLICYPTPDSSERESPSWILFSCILSILKVLLNLTNDNAGSSTRVGEQDGLMFSTLGCVLNLPSHLLIEQRFELLVLSLGLLINLVEHSDSNRQRLFVMDVTPQVPLPQSRRKVDSSAPKALVNLFMEHEEAARLEEAKTDRLLDGKGEAETNPEGANKEDGSAPPQGTIEDMEETLTKALQKAGKNMEDSMVAAYIALLLGCLIQDSRDNAIKVRDYLPNRDFDIMVKMLKKFLNFMHLANVVGSTGMKSIQRVIDILEAT